jgi:hypothetical protein
MRQRRAFDIFRASQSRTCAVGRLPSAKVPGSAIQAEVKRGEVKQFYVRRVETGAPGAFEQLTNEELQQALIEQTRELAELDPEFAKELRLNQRAKSATKH